MIHIYALKGRKLEQILQAVAQNREWNEAHSDTKQHKTVGVPVGDLIKVASIIFLSRLLAVQR